MSIYDELEKIGYVLDSENYDVGTNSFSVALCKNEPDGTSHIIIIEDHRWERNEPDFIEGEPNNVGDWLIFSLAKDSEVNWFGNALDEQYPLTLTEYRYIENLIKNLEKRGNVK